MKSLKSSIAGLLLTIAISPAAWAQAPTQWDLTQQFTGNWSGLADLNLEGTSFPVNYNLHFVPAVDGNALTMDESFDDATLGSFRGSNLIGLNAGDGLIHWFSVDNFGTAHEHTGSWVNPRHFYMEHQSDLGGQVFREEIHFRMRANGTRMLVTLVATLDGAVIETISGTLYLQQNGNRIREGVTSQESTWEVFPNPASGSIYVTGEVPMDEIYIYNENGQEVYRNTLSASDCKISLEHPGIYIVSVRTGNVIEHQKVVVR